MRHCPNSEIGRHQTHRAGTLPIPMRGHQQPAVMIGQHAAQSLARDLHDLLGQARGAFPTIRMYSIPASKGLEFDHVIIPDVNGGVFDGTNQEERNLFYVAASRARKELTMTYQTRPSSFLPPFEDSAHWDVVHSSA